jgi:probable F420-dependent oxidoreductase
VRIGVVFPQLEIGPDRGAVVAYAEAVQELGFAHLLAFDHVVGANPAGHPGWDGPYTHEEQFHEPLVLFGYLAAVAPKLELVTSILILPQRQTALVAKQVAELDLLTAGKFRLGVGQGWNQVEYEALGVDFANRGDRLEEQIELLRKFFTEDSFSFEGRYHRVTAAGINPLPLRRPPPIWVGAGSDRALRRAARVADGLFPQRPLGLTDPAPWAATLGRVRGWVAEAGRDPGAFGIDRRIVVGPGTPDDWRRDIDEWRALGATHLSLDTMGGGLTTVDAHVARLAEALELVSG